MPVGRQERGEGRRAATERGCAGGRPAGRSPAREVLALQRTMGNRAVNRMLQRTVTKELMDQAAATLDKVEGTAPVVVVPDGFNLSAANPGITIKDEAKLGTYRRMIEASGDYEAEAQERAKRLLAINTILVKEAVVRDGGIWRDGVIWHEYGHVVHGAAENGKVFAFELDALSKHYGREELRDWVDRRRGGTNYFARFVSDPGIAELGEKLKAIGFTDFDQKRKAVELKTKVEKKKFVMTGQKIQGTEREIVDQTGFAADAKLPPGVEEGKEFGWRNGSKWRCIKKWQDEGSEEWRYNLERVA